MTKIVINMDSNGIGDGILGTAIATGFKNAYPQHEVFYRVRKHISSWFSMYKDVPVVTDPVEGATELYPFNSYGKELASSSEVPRIEFYSRECWNVLPSIPTWEVPQEQINWAKKWENHVVIFPYSFWNSRSYPLYHWLIFEKMLIAKGESTLILDSPGDGVRTQMFQGFRLWGQGALNLAAIIKVSKYVVGNDSGMIHLAGALDRPAVAVCGPTAGNKVFGFWRSVKTINGKLPCDSCYWRGTNYIDKICKEGCTNLATITPQDLIDLKYPKPKKIFM